MFTTFGEASQHCGNGGGRTSTQVFQVLITQFSGYFWMRVRDWQYTTVLIGWHNWKIVFSNNTLFYRYIVLFERIDWIISRVVMNFTYRPHIFSKRLTSCHLLSNRYLRLLNLGVWNRPVITYAHLSQIDRVAHFPYKRVWTRRAQRRDWWENEIFRFIYPTIFCMLHWYLFSGLWRRCP